MLEEKVGLQWDSTSAIYRLQETYLSIQWEILYHILIGFSTCMSLKLTKLMKVSLNEICSKVSIGKRYISYLEWSETRRYFLALLCSVAKNMLLGRSEKTMWVENECDITWVHAGQNHVHFLGERVPSFRNPSVRFCLSFVNLWHRQKMWCGAIWGVGAGCLQMFCMCRWPPSTSTSYGVGGCYLNEVYQK
jgi:hypothetical protein